MSDSSLSTDYRGNTTYPGSLPNGLSTEDTATLWQNAVRDAHSNPDRRHGNDGTSQMPPDSSHDGDDGGDSPGWVASAFSHTFGHVDPNQWAAQGAAAGGASGALVGGIAGGTGGGLGGAGAGTLVAPGVGTVGGGIAGGTAGATEGAAAGGVAGAVAGGLIGKAAGTFIVYMEGTRESGATRQGDKSAQNKQTEGSATGKLTGSLDSLTPAEKDFAQEQLAAGHDVEVVPTGTQRTPDFKIDGKPVELKTLSGVQNQTSDGLSKAVSDRILAGRGQSPNIVVDARKQPGMTKEFAERGIDRAVGFDKISGSKLQNVTVLTPDGLATFRR